MFNTNLPSRSAPKGLGFVLVAKQNIDVRDYSIQPSLEERDLTEERSTQIKSEDLDSKLGIRCGFMI